MIVGDLLELEDLRLGLAWGTPELLGRQVTGVTSTDLQDPARYLQPGELVLSGLVWWQPASGREGAALRFANSLRSAGVAALLAGEGTHGWVPPSLVDACRTHGIPLLTVPSATSFRAVTDRIYLRLWGDPGKDAGRAMALPELARQELADLLDGGEPLARVLALAVVRLGLPDCAVLSATGRVIAASGSAGAADPADGSAPHPSAIALGPAGGSPFDGWQLTPGTHPLMHGLAELLAPVAAAARSEIAARRNAAAALLDLLGTGGAADRTDLADAIGACGLAPDQELTPIAVRIDRAPAAWALDALTEALHSTGAGFVAGPDSRGEAIALVGGPVRTDLLRELLPRLQARLTSSQVLRIGVGPTVAPTATELRAALVRARYALAGADPFADADEPATLAALLRGVPVEVTDAYRQRVLGPLEEHDRENSVSLLGTLTAFLDCDGSWARTAKALHVHVNTVHYRVRRIEELIRRDLSRLPDQTDVRTALQVGRP
ncbi:PucR family transcriptional regulator [Streptacidiphilus sp. EB129]|uniref:PucR family transcriptional regulator n=1 Tax=Streptacidiphilus sp. EB129 TaxID=3156262 RepID=UPI00351724ED